MKLPALEAGMRAVVATMCSSLLAIPASAASVPLAELLVDARTEVPRNVINVDRGNLGHRASGWEYEADSGRAWGLGERSRIELNRVPERGLLILTGKPFLHRGSRVQTVEVLINDQVISRFRLVPWERSYRIRIPSRLLSEARIMLSLEYRWAARPVAVLSGSDDTRSLAVSWSSIRLEATATPSPTTIQAEGDEVVLRGGARVRIPLKATRPVTFAAESIDASGAAALQLTLGDAGDTQHRLWKRGGIDLKLQPGVDRENPHARLTLQAEPRRWWRRLVSFGPPELRIDGARIEAEEVVWPSWELGRMGFFHESATGTDTRPDLVVLWVVDTLRADHLGLYGYQRDTSPRLDAFAAEAVTFDRAVAQSAWTRPSVTSILTGQLVKRHGVYDKQHALAREATTLAEILSDQGFDTAAFITNGNLRHVGLEQGFGTFRHFKEGRIREFHYPAPEVTRAALEWLDRGPPRRAFIYLHATDPHMPYAPMAPFAHHWPVEDPSLNTIEGFQQAIRRPQPATQDLIDLYDAEIRQADAAFGELLDGLGRRGLYDRALIIFSADHGEEFLDHGAWQHGNSLFAEQIDVPLVIRWPQGTSPYAPGSRVQAVAGHADLAPTILGAAGVTPPPAMQGRNLAEPDSRPTFAELRDTYRATVDRRYKLITDLGGNLLRLYDRKLDPADRHDLSFALPAVLEYHRRLHALFLERSGGGPGAESADQDPETIEQLKALGYLN